MDMNIRNGIFVFFTALWIISSAVFSVELGAEERIHTVQKGETVYSISRSFRVSPEELMRHNNIVDASRLQIGMRLRIPDSLSIPSQAAARASYTEYRVARNDTLYGIARTNGVSVESLRAANDFSPDRVLKAGELIRIPESQAATRTGTSGRSPAREQTPPQREPEPRSTASRTVDTALRWPVQPKQSAYMTGKLFGVVLTGERAEAVKSLTQGTVVSAGPYRGFGRVAIVEVTGGYLYVYGGCESLSVKEGDKVGPGTELGKLGIDAVSEKPQLFFLVYRSNTPIDPAKAPRA
jgi:murein DD-endopeptidase MepM/ murein hydrolase activator NlpD